MSAMFKELRATVEAHTTVKVEIHDLECNKRELEFKITEMVVEERMFECLSVNFSRLNRLLKYN